MDKKILLSGVAALLMTGAMFAPSASASALSVSMSGEGSISASFNDACKDSDVNVDTGSFTGAATVTEDSTATSCSGTESDDMPVWKTESELSFSASGTLANGLGVSVDLGKGAVGGAGKKIGLSGAFGSISWKADADSAVKLALPNAAGDLTTASRDDLGGHTLATDGTAGTVVTYSMPSVGGMDLFVTYAPSSEDKATNTDKYLDTIAIGATMAAGDITVGAGWETATANASGAECATITAVNDGTAAVAPNSLSDVADAGLGGAFCGDQTLMGIGASMSVADLSINAGYTKLDTEEADKTTYNVGVSTSVGEYSLGLDYVNSSKAYEFGGTSLDQTVLGVSLGTSLGDGVDLSVGFNTSSVDVAQTGAHSNYNAEVKLTATF